RAPRYAHVRRHTCFTRGSAETPGGTRASRADSHDHKPYYFHWFFILESPEKRKQRSTAHGVSHSEDRVPEGPAARPGHRRSQEDDADPRERLSANRGQRQAPPRSHGSQRVGLRRAGGEDRP